MGLPAERASRQTTPQLNDIVIRGSLLSIEEGSAATRVGIGFSSGASELKTMVEGYQMTTEGPRLLGSGELQSAGAKTPGMVLPLGVLAATGNPIGLVVMGGAKVAMEATGRSRIEGAAKQTAEAIADQLRIRFKEQGWIH